MSAAMLDFPDREGKKLGSMVLRRDQTARKRVKPRNRATVLDEESSWPG